MTRRTESEFIEIYNFLQLSSYIVIFSKISIFDGLIKPLFLTPFGDLIHDLDIEQELFLNA